MTDRLFLTILKASLRGEQAVIDTALSDDGWAEIFRLAEIHRVLPMIFDSAYSTYPSDGEGPENVRAYSKMLVLQQTVRTQSFLALYRDLAEQGLEPVIVKGIVCRSLYPKPDLRFSSDEDVLIPGEEADRYSEALMTAGLKAEKADDGHYQASYFRDDGLHLELHKTLFPTASDYFNEYNRVFEGALGRAVYIEIDGTNIKTLSPTDHLLYLILHALKHFIHSGVGIRQVCDITLFAHFYSSEIDWNYVFRQCEKLGAEQFASAIFAIGEKHLGFSEVKAHLPEKYRSESVDEAPLLQDILTGGVYGSAHRGRQHSSSFTLSAAQGKKASLARRIFPPAASLSSRYTYAKNHPILLPIAWSERLIRYGKETRKEEGNNPVASLQIGKERLALLSKYGLLTRKKSKKN